MREAPLFNVIYDISCDRERRRVDKTLAGFGFRVQKSAYECRLTRGAKQLLVSKLEQLCIETGQIRLYRVYSGAATVSIGAGRAEPDGESAYVF